jgi:hypothetical protein
MTPTLFEGFSPRTEGGDGLCEPEGNTPFRPSIRITLGREPLSSQDCHPLRDALCMAAPRVAPTHEADRLPLSREGAQPPQHALPPRAGPLRGKRRVKHERGGKRVRHFLHCRPRFEEAIKRIAHSLPRLGRGHAPPLSPAIGKRFPRGGTTPCLSFLRSTRTTHVAGSSTSRQCEAHLPIAIVPRVLSAGPAGRSGRSHRPKEVSQLE